MDSETKQHDNIPTVEVENTSSDLVPVSSQPTESDDGWQFYKEKLNEILAELPDRIGVFFNEYQRLIVLVSLVIGTVITIRVLLAVLDAVNEIPLLAPTFELIGMSYSTWFIFRFLLRASTREELRGHFETYKNQVMGQDSPQA